MKFKDFKHMFVGLTKVTVPYGSEYMYYKNYMEPLIDFKCYRNGENFYHIVGDGSDKTLFCAHLDTASKIGQPIDHEFEGCNIFTRSNTILGADDKAGVMVMIYLIQQQVPGTYYFFAGEECGRIGSIQAAKDITFFSKFDRAIQYDRRGYGSIITDQWGGPCCSDMFCDALAGEFRRENLKFESDPTGSYTDTASFMEIIPECTNISIGYFGEHTTHEHININYAWQVARASANINWDLLPVERDPKKSYSKYSSRYHGNDDDFFYQRPSSYQSKPPVVPPKPKVEAGSTPGTFGRGGAEYYPPKHSIHSKPPFLTAEEALSLSTSQREAIEIEFDELLNPIIDGKPVAPPKVM